MCHVRLLSVILRLTLGESAETHVRLLAQILHHTRPLN